MLGLHLERIGVTHALRDAERRATPEGSPPRPARRSGLETHEPARTGIDGVHRVTVVS
jgi:hypothetical protein